MTLVQVPLGNYRFLPASVPIFSDGVVADAGGAVLIPAVLLDEVVELAVRKERFDEWAVREVKNGAPLPGLYPPNAETKARYEAEIAQRKGL